MIGIDDARLASLVWRMKHKSQNIKARFEPQVFVDVACALEELQAVRSAHREAVKKYTDMANRTAAYSYGQAIDDCWPFEDK